MRTWVHVLGILGGIAATAGFEGWTTSSHGPRSKAHYASVENVSMTPREVALAYERSAFGQHSIEHVAADGNIVMVHYQSRDDRGATAGVDIYRIDQRKVAERWSISQAQAAVPSSAP